jgi:hypothetical protein
MNALKVILNAIRPNRYTTTGPPPRALAPAPAAHAQGVPVRVISVPTGGRDLSVAAMGDRLDTTLTLPKSSIVTLPVESAPPGSFEETWLPRIGCALAKGKVRRIERGPQVTDQTRAYLRNAEPVIFPPANVIQQYHDEVYTPFFKLEALKETAGAAGIIEAMRRTRDALPDALAKGELPAGLEALDMESQGTRNRHVRAQCSISQAPLTRRAIDTLQPFFSQMAEKARRICTELDEADRARATQFGTEYKPSNICLALAYLAIVELHQLEDNWISGYPFPQPPETFFGVPMWERNAMEQARHDACVRAVTPPAVSPRMLDLARAKAIEDGDKERARLAHIEEVKRISAFNDKCRLEGEAESARKRAERDAAQRPMKVVIANEP